MRDKVINTAIDKLMKLTGEDFHGYRSEVWGVLAEVFDSRPDTGEGCEEDGCDQKADRHFCDKHFDNRLDAVSEF